MSHADEAFADLVGANPVPDRAATPETAWTTSALLDEIDARNVIMEFDQLTKDQTDRPSEDPTQPPGQRWRPGSLLLIAAAAVIVVIVAVALFDGTEETLELDVVDSPADVDTPAPTEPAVPEPVDLPSFAADPTLVGDALTAAWASGDGDVFLSLFAPDAKLTHNGSEVPNFEGALLPLRPDEGYETVMNQTIEWSDCKPLGTNETAPIRCETQFTDDWYALVGRGPYAGPVTIRSAAGQIVEYEFRDSGTDTDTIVTWGRFRNWAFENHPDEAATMWESEPTPTTRAQAQRFLAILTEESARLWLQLGAEFVEECTSDEALGC